jgi:hypothetical protein
MRQGCVYPRRINANKSIESCFIVPNNADVIALLGRLRKCSLWYKRGLDNRYQNHDESDTFEESTHGIDPYGTCAVPYPAEIKICKLLSF